MELEAVSQKEKGSYSCKKELKSVHKKKKKKIDTPISVDMENILMEHNICAASYHGGDLMGWTAMSLISCIREFLIALKHIY
jgi:hypothetical protein